MPRLTILAFTFSMLGWLTGCSTPEHPVSAVYPADTRISSPEGVPHDSATSYFPVSANVNTSQDALIRQFGDCEFLFRSASEDLFGFKAPVLSNYYLGHAIYRFLWWRYLDRPVLLTLELSETGGVLRTQFLSKTLLVKAPSLVQEQGYLKQIAEMERFARTEEGAAQRAKVLKIAKDARDTLKLRMLPLKTITGKPVALSNAQVQQFCELLKQTGFWQLPSCEPTHLTDGSNILLLNESDWVLEAHEPNRYKVVFRQDPSNEQASFRRCCEFLLNLSEARSEVQH